jgi:Rubicon Homology Domain
VLHGTRAHLVNDLEYYSLRDLVDATRGELIKYLREVAKLMLCHIRSCRRCLLRGRVSTLLWRVEERMGEE